MIIPLDFYDWVEHYDGNKDKLLENLILDDDPDSHKDCILSRLDSTIKEYEKVVIYCNKELEKRKWRASNQFKQIYWVKMY